MLKRTSLLASGRNSNSRTSRGKDKAKPGRLASAIKPVLETLETRQMLSLAAGSLDPTFGTSGLLTTSLSTEDQGSAVAVDSTSGDIFVAGTSNNHFTLIAYSPSGTEITSSSVAIGTGSSSANAVTIDASHNIWVAGVADDGTGKGNDFVLAKYSLSGSSLSLNSSIGVGGVGYVTTDVQTGKSDTGNAVAVDGSDILVAGDSGSGTTQRAAVVAYHSSDGSLDTGFGTGGKVIGTGTSESANGIAVSSSGIIVAGQASSKAEILLINSTGTSVTSKFPAVGGSSNLTAVVADGSDDLLAGTADSNFVLAAVNASSGLLDSSFGTGGVTETAFSGAAQANAIALQSNGKIVLAGSTTVSGNQVFAVARYSVTGSADSAFGTGGVSLSASFSSANSIAAGVAVEPDGKIVAAGSTGSTTDSFAVARYVANNAPTGAGSASFSTIDASETNSPGDSVTALVGQLAPADLDGDTVGLAVTATDDSNGTWQYSTDTGLHWTAIPAVSDASAFVLTKLASNLIRFVPNTAPTPFTGSATITLRLWDQTQTYANASLINAYNSTVTNTSANSGPSAQNLNSFSDAAFTATIAVSSLVSPVYVDQLWAGSAQDATVSDSHGTHTFGIDAFATIQDGVTFVASGGTVIVDAGTYAESVTIGKPLNLLGAESNVDTTGRATAFVGGKADPTLESVITSPIVDPTDATNDLLHVDASNVTINGFVIDGNNAAIANQLSATVINGVNTDSRRAIETENASGSLVTEGSVAVEYNVIQNFAQRGVELANSSDTSPATSGDVVTQNVISNFGTTGVLMAFNAYGSVTHNTIIAPAGVNAGVMVQDYTNNTAVPSSLDVSNNNVTIGQDGAGIWVNLFHPTVATALTVNSNTVNAATGVTGTDGFTFGIYLSSINTAGPVVSASGNLVGTTGGQFAAGIDLWNLPTSTPVGVSSGSIGNSAVGIQVDNDDISFGAGAATTVDISGVSISGAGTGILVSGDSVGAAVAADISGATTNISGGTTGIKVDGPNASLSFSGSAPASLSGLSGNYITVSGGAMNSGGPNFTPSVIDASRVSFDGVVGSSGPSLSSAYSIEDRITDYLDNRTVGYVSLNSSKVYVAASSDAAGGGTAGAIQRGINVAVANGTVNLQAGTYVGANLPDTTNGYVDAVQITKSLSLIGPNPTYDPTQTEPVSQAILLPGSSDPSFDSTESAGIEIAANNVTVEGLTFDGSNPNLTHSGNVIFNGVPIDAAEGIDGFSGLSGVTVAHNIIKNTDYAGVNFGNASAATSDNTISNNRIENLSDALGFGVGVIVYNNFYAQINNNVMSDVNVGVQTNNFSNANSDPSFVASISDNQIAATGVGIFYNLMYDASSPFTVAGNTITAISSSSDAPWDGVLLTSIQIGVNVDFTGNSIDGSNAFESATEPTTGYNIWNTPTTGNVLISGGTVSGVDYGVWVNTFEGFDGPANATHATISGINITANKVGVYVEDSSANTNHPAASATIEGDTDITTSSQGTGILVSGANATATITGNDSSIHGNTIGIDVDGGSATITNNHIYNNGTGIEFTNGGSGSVSGNNFAGSTNNGTDLLIDSTAGTISIGDGNSFSGNTYYIENLSTQNFDLSTDSNTVFGSNPKLGSLTAPADLSAFYGIEDKIVDYLDFPADGYVQLVTNNVFIAHSSEADTAGAIQRGVTVASVGGTVYVQAGTFDISAGVSLSKAITLIGAQAGVAGTNASRGSGESILNASSNQSNAAFTIGTTSAVTLNGFTFNGSKIIAGEPSAVNLSFIDDVFTLQAMAASGGTNIILSDPNQLTLTDNHFITTGFNPSNSAVIQIAGNYAGGADTTNDVNVTGNTFTGIGNFSTPNPGNGQSTLQLNLAGVHGIVQSNTFNGVDIGVIVADASGNLTIDNNTFDNITRGATEIGNGSFGAGVLIFTPSFTNGPITISNNTFENSDSGIRTSNAGGTLAGATVNITGNTFSGDVYDIVNKVAGTLTPSGTNTFDGVTLGGASDAQLYAIEDKIVDDVDVSGYGLVRLKAGNIYVTPNSYFVPGGTSTPSVQRGIDAASSGDTVNIENGTYVGQVQIAAKNLTLLGQSEGGVVIQADSNLVIPAGFTSEYPTVYATGGTVTLNDLTVDGNAQGNTYADGFLGVAYFNAGGTVQNVTIENVENNPFNGVQNGVALYAGNADGSSRTLNVTNNTINNYQKNGMSLGGNGLSVSVTGNIVTGAGATTQIGQNGIEIDSGVTGTISGNTISGNEYSGSGSGSDWFTETQSTGLFLAGASGLQVTGNTIDGNDIGIYNSAAGAVISNNHLGNNAPNRYFGILQDPGSATISGNTIQGGNVGVEIVTSNGETNASTAILDGNTISGASVGLASIRQSSAASAVQVLAQNNNFAGNTEGVLISGGATVDLGTDTTIGDPNARPANFSGLGTSVGNNTLTGYTGVGGNYAIDDENTSSQPNVQAQNNNFGNVSAADAFSAIGAVIHDSADSSAFSTVYYIPAQNEQPAPSVVYVDNNWAGTAIGSTPVGAPVGTEYGYNDFSTIQDGINAVASGGTVMIDNGTYDPSNILIPIPVTIEGQSESGVIVTPSLTDSHDDSSFGGATISNGFIIAASHVTIEDLTLDGGASQNFRNGIITNSENDGNTYSNLDIENVDIKNVYRKGIALYNFSGESTNNTIKNDTFSNIGTTINSYEATAAVAVFSSDATISGNHISNSAGGIEANAEDGAGNPLVSITGNFISSPQTTMTQGALGIDAGSLADGSVISNNTVDLTGTATAHNDIGIVVSFVQGNVTVSGDTVTGTGGDDGILLYQDALSSDPVLLQDNLIQISGSDSGDGILLTASSSDTGRFGDGAGAVYATLTGNTVTGFAVGIADVSDGAAGDIVSTTIGGSVAGDSNSITGTAGSTGILVTGVGAAAIISDNATIQGNATGIDVEGGTATISGNTISGATVGVKVAGGIATINNSNVITASENGVLTQGGTSTISGNTITGSIAGVDVDGGSATINGGNTINGNTGVEVDTGSAAVSNSTINGTTTGVLIAGGTGATSISGNTIDGSTSAAIRVDAKSPSISGNSISGAASSIGIFIDGTGDPTIGAGNTIDGVSVGLSISGTSAGIVGNTLNNLAFTNISGNYVTLAGGAEGGATPTQLDATNVLFGTVLGSAAGLSQAYTIEDKISDYLDDPTLGYVMLNLNNVYVSQVSDNTTNDAVQRGVNVSAVGGTVNVQAGTFIGQVSITENLSLVGAGQASTTIVAPASMSALFTTSRANVPVVYVNHATAAIDDLTVNGNAAGLPYASASKGFYGIAYFNASGTIDHVTVEHVRDSTFDGLQTGVAILADDTEAPARSVTMTNDNIFDYQKGGILANGTGLTVDIDTDTVTGHGTTAITAQNGIQVSSGATGTINNDTVSGDSYNGSSVADAAAILLDDSAVGTSVTNNIISGSDIGVFAVDTAGAVGITGNTITGSPSAAIAVSEDPGFSSAFTITGNTMQNGVGDNGPAFNTGDGIDLFGNISGSTIQNNLIQNNTGTGIFVGSNVTDSSAPLTVNNNSISGNATAGLDNESTITVNATSNWWGSANGPQAPSNSFNIGHQGDKITGPGTTTFAPWLTTNAHTAQTPGFYPTGVTSAPVEDLTQGTFFGSIQAAVNASHAGDTITVAAGTYIENVTVPHNLTIEGAGNTSDPTASSVVESASNGPVFEISGGTVSLQNFYITAGINGKTAGVQVDAGAGVTISHIAINDPAVGLTVAALASATVDDSTISNNLTGIISSGTLTVDDGSVISSNSVTGVELDGGSANLTGSTITGNAVGLWLEGNNITATGGIQNDSETDIDCKITGNNDTAQNMEMDTALQSVINSGTNNRLVDDTMTGSKTGVEVQAGNLELDGVSISGATIGVQIDATASATIKDDGTNPTIISAGGEGILVNGSLATQPQVPASGHTALEVYGMTASATSNGYGIEIGSGGTAQISDTELGIGSQASENGGTSIRVDSGAGAVSVSNSSFTDNTIAAVDVEGGTVTLSGDTFDNTGLHSGTPNKVGAGILIGGGSVTVTHTSLSGFGFAIKEQGVANPTLSVGDGTDSNANTISSNDVGVQIDSGSANINDNSFSNETTDIIVNGSSASAAVHKNLSDGSAKGQASEFALLENGASATFTGNTIENDGTGIDAEGSGSVTVGDGTAGGSNSFTNNGTGIVWNQTNSASQALLSVTDNSFNDDSVSIAIKKQGSPTQSIALSNNSFTSDTTVAIQIDDGAVAITGNTMTGNAIAADVDGDGKASFSGNTFTDDTTGVIADSSAILVSSNDTWIYDASETASSVIGVEVTSHGSADISGGKGYVHKNGSFSSADFNYIVSSGGLTVEGGTQIGGFGVGVQISGGIAIVKNSTIGAFTVSPLDIPGNATGLESTGGTVTVQDSTFDDNTVSGIDIETGGAVIVNGGTFQNTALESTTQGTVVYNGDGIDDNSASPNSLTFNGGTITHTSVGMRYRPGNNKTTRIKITREWSNDVIASNGTGVEIDGGGADIGDALDSAHPTTTGGADFSDNGTAVVVDGDGQANLIDNTITGGAGQIGIDDSSSRAVDSTGDTIHGSSGNNLLVAQRMHKPFPASASDVTSGDVISHANTGIDIEGGGQATLIGNTLTDDSVGIDDESTGAVTSTGDTIGGTSATDVTTTAVHVGHDDSMSIDADQLGFTVTAIDDDGTIHITSTTISDSTTGVNVHSDGSATIVGTTISDGGTGIDSSGSVTVKGGRVIGMTSGGGNKGNGIEIDDGNATIGGSNAGDGVDIENNVTGIDTDGNGGLDRASIIGNTLTNNTTGVLIENGAGVDLSGNTINISADQIGIDDQSTGSVTSAGDVLDGTQSQDAQTIAVRVGHRGSMSLNADELGFVVTGIDDDGTIHITHTTVSNATTGVTAESDAVSVLIDGGSSLSNDVTGVDVEGGTVTIDNTAISGGTTGILDNNGVQHVTVQNNSSIIDNGTGVELRAIDSFLTFSAVAINSNSTGISIDAAGGTVVISGSTLSGNATGIEMSSSDDSATLDSTTKIALPSHGVGVLFTATSDNDSLIGGSMSDAISNGVAATNTTGVQITDNLGKRHNYIGHVTIVKPTIGVDDFGQVTLFGDVIDNNDIGVKVESTGVATIGDPTMGTAGVGNEIDGNTIGIEFTAGSSGSVSNNFIQGNGTGVLFDSGFTGSTTVVDNNISGNTTAGLNNASSASINADLNYWGTSNGPKISTNPGGTGDVILGSHVTFIPWLTNGTDADADRTDGFQPEPGDTVPSNLILTLSSSKINEDGSTNLSGSFTDTGSVDTHTVDINWGDGSADTILTLPATTLSFSNVAHQYLDNPTGQPHGSFTISVTVTDTDGASTGANTSVEVDNLAPAVGITGAPSSAGVPAGPALVLGSTIADPSPIDQAASFTYVWTVTLNGNPYTTNLSGTSGSITPSGITGPSLTFTSTPLFGNYVATLVVTDKDGGQTTTSTSFKINEVTPAITLSGSQTDPTNLTPNDAEGSTFTLTLGALQDSDLIHGGDTVSSYTILWGDGSTNITGAQLANLVANGGTVTHVYEDGLTPESTTPNTTIQVIVDITDGFGTQHAFSPATGGSLPIDVYNVAPIAQLTGTSSVQEGSTGFVQFLNQSDVSPVDSAAGFTYEYDFNNSGNFSSPTTNSFATVPASVLATPGTDTVAARIFDKDGGFTTDTFQITVNNVAPSINAIPNITNQPQNSAFHVNGTFTDPGSDSAWVVFVNYDSTHVAGIGSQIQSGPSKGFSLSNTYATPGVYTVLVTVQDLGGPSNNSLSLSGSTTFTVTVTATTFQVSQFTPTPSGFDVTFNRAVDTSSLRLYGSTLVGGGGTTSDLTITGQNTGRVTGSVVWDPTTNTAHFIKTGGPLVDDVYSVSLLSGPNGWKDTSGNQLDGLDNGGTSNYTNTITVNAPTNEPVVSIPDFARGPGQSVNVTPAPTANTTALGLPVSIFNATNIVAVDFDLVYNPALLSITGATKAPGLPSNWGLTVNQVSASQFNFTLSGTTPISGSMLSLLILTAKIPNGAAYASAADLLLTNLIVSQQSVGTIPSLADSTVQKVAYLGDSDGDGTLTGNDAGLISRLVVHLDTGFDAYSLTDPALIADVSNDGVVTGFDASEDLAASVGFSEPTIPSIPNLPTLVTGGIDPNVNIGSNIIAAGGTAVVPINIGDLTGVNGLTVTVVFNSSAVQLSDGSDVVVSNALSPYFTAIYNPANGKIGIEENNPPANGLTGPATLVNLTFTVPANSNPGVDSVTVTGPASVGTGATKLNYTYTNGSIVIPPTFTGNNQFTVALDGSGNVDIWQDVPETAAPTYVFAQSLLNTPGFSVFSFTTTQSGGSLTIDDKNGNPLPTGGVAYNATGTGNSVVIDGNNAGGDAVTVGSSSAALDGDALSLSNVQNFVFNGGAANDTLTQSSQPTVNLTFNGNGGADILNVNGGSYTLSGSENPTESLTVNVNNAGSSATFGSSYSLAALNIGNGASAQIALSSSTPSVLVTSAMSILGTGKLDMTNNELILHSSAANRVGDLASLTNLLASGASFNNFATYWTGSGIDSSTAAGNHSFTTGVGILLNDGGNLTTLGPTYTTTFGGQTVSNTDILVRFTYHGDADLNGTVNATDYTLVDNGFNTGQTGWVHGDFNYDQSVNGDDYTLMDNAFNTQSANQVQVLAVDSEQVAPPAPSTAAAPAPATIKAPAATNAVAATGGSTAGDTTDLKKKHRSIYNLVEDSDQSNS